MSASQPASKPGIGPAAIASPFREAIYFVVAVALFLWVCDAVGWFHVTSFRHR